MNALWVLPFIVLAGNHADVAHNRDVAMRLRLPIETIATRCLAYAPDGTLLAAGQDSGYVTIWDPRSGTVVNTMKAHCTNVESITFDATGARILTASGMLDYMPEVTIWDATTWRPMHTIEGWCGTPMSVTCAADTETWAIDLLLAMPGARCSYRNIIVLTSQGIAHWYQPTATGGLASEIKYSDYDGCLWAAMDDGRIVSWCEPFDEPYTTFCTDADVLRRIDMSPLNGQIVVGGIQYYSGVHGKPEARAILEIWDARTGEREHQLLFEETGVTSVAFSSNGANVWCGFRNGVLRLVDALSGDVRATVPTDLHPPDAIACNPSDAREVAIGGLASEVVILRVADR